MSLQGYTCLNISSLDRWIYHIKGITALLRLRQLKLFREGHGRRAFEYIRRLLVSNFTLE